MQILYLDADLKRKLRIILSILFIEYLIMLLSGITFISLKGNSLFSIGVDPFFWMIYMCRIPQIILNYYWLAILCDIIIILSFILLFYNPLKYKIAIVLFLMLLVSYMTYAGAIDHRNYMTGFFLVLIPFLFRTNKSRQISFEALRYFLLFFYFSAAFIKLQQSNIYNLHYFSNILINQFTPYYLEQNYSIRTDVNLYLVVHPSFARLLFLSGSFLEFITLVGFFTKRFDKYLALFILFFHFTNWFIMDIAAVGQIAFISILFFSKTFEWKLTNI